jgi:membrane protein required for beta-lactamase induction
MNAHNIGSFIKQDTSIHKSIAAGVLEYGLVIGFFVFGIILDTLFNQLIGSQYCSYSDGEQICVFGKTRIKTWVRELVRVVLQLIAVFLFFYVIQKLINLAQPSLLINLGIIMYIVGQKYIFEDFRRLINSIIFFYKYQ